MSKNTDWKAKWEVDVVIELGKVDPTALGNYVMADIQIATTGQRRKLSLQRIADLIKKNRPEFYFESYARACQENGVRFSEGASATSKRLAQQAKEIEVLKAKIIEMEASK